MILDVAAPIASNLSVDAVASEPPTATHLIDADGTNLSVHVLPIRPPISMQQTPTGTVLAAVHSTVISEDSVGFGITIALNPQGSAVPFVFELVTAPAIGDMWAREAGSSRASYMPGRDIPLATPGQQWSNFGAGYAFNPPSQASGKNLANFSWRARLVDFPLYASQIDTHNVDVDPINDLPTAQGGTYRLIEDSAMINVSLVAADAEGEYVDIVITRLPTLGRIYLPSSGERAR